MKKKITALLAAVVLLLSLCSCGAKPNQIVLFPEAVKYKVHRASNSTNEFSFTMNIFSPKRDVNLEFVSAQGENTEHMTVRFTDETIRDIGKINGKYFVMKGVYFRPISDYVRIDSMTLKVNGEERTVKFDTPVENTFFNMDDYDYPLFQKGVANYISTTSLADGKDSSYPFEFGVSSDMTITGAEFDDFIELRDTVIFVNDKERGKLSDILPLKLKDGDTVSFKGQLRLKKENESYAGDMFTDFVITGNSGGKEIKEYFPLSVVYVGNEDDAKNFVKANVK